MGNYYCKKCCVPSKYYQNHKYKTHSCRYHKYNKNNICLDCGLCENYGGNCRHIYKYYLPCFNY